MQDGVGGQGVVQGLVSKRSFLIESLAQLVQDMAIFLPADTQQWATAALHLVPDATLAAKDKEEFMRSLQNALAQPEDLKHRLVMQVPSTPLPTIAPCHSVPNSRLCACFIECMCRQVYYVVWAQ